VEGGRTRRLFKKYGRGSAPVWKDGRERPVEKYGRPATLALTLFDNRIRRARKPARQTFGVMPGFDPGSHTDARRDMQCDGASLTARWNAGSSGRLRLSSTGCARA
jgi:hypothetical protein